ncbi:response regulator transcription factor [Globicatella sulfidifaciens]
MKRILVVDDESSIVTLLQYTLENAGYEVDVALDGKTAYQMIKSEKYDFIVLDVMLPQMSGMDVCRRVRQKGIQIPILMLTARADEYDKIIGLELGADDYMTKPFSPNEVLARIKAILRRSSVSNYRVDDEIEESEVEEVRMTPDNSVPIPENDNQKTYGDLTILTDRFEVWVRGEQIEITPKEYELLVYMTDRQGRTLSREQLLTQVWQFDYLGETRIVDVHISNLREKIERNNKNPEYIITVRGFGYRFEVPDYAK